MLLKPCLKALHFAKSGGAVYNDHVRAQPMVWLKRREISSLRAFHFVHCLYSLGEQAGQHTPFGLRMFKKMRKKPFQQKDVFCSFLELELGFTESEAVHCATELLGTDNMSLFFL